MASDESSPFIYTAIETDPIINFVNSQPWANQHLSIKDYSFEACVLPKSFAVHANEFRDFLVRKEDIWVVSFPKSGTTWVQNIIWQLKNGLQFTKEPISLNDAQFLEWPMYGKSVDQRLKQRLDSLFPNSLDELNRAPSPRIIKSHLPPHLLPVQLWTVRPKIIYIVRNPKDAVCSLYHMVRNDFNKPNLTWPEHYERFLTNSNWYMPYGAHVKSFWEFRHLDHFLFLQYEQLSANRVDGLKKIATFLGCKYDHDQLNNLSTYISFDNMQKMNTKELLITENRDPSYRYVMYQCADALAFIFASLIFFPSFRFFRRGKVGGFADEMNEDMIQKFNEWIVNEFQNTDFDFRPWI